MPKKKENIDKVVKKLTMITLRHRYVNKTVFITLPYIDGRAKLTVKEFNSLVKQIFPSAERGDTIAWI